MSQKRADCGNPGARKIASEAITDLFVHMGILWCSINGWSATHE